MKSIFDKEYRDLISKLQKTRIKLGYSQTHLANKLGYSQSYISKIEQGQIRLDVVQLKKLANALETDYRELLK